MDWSKILKEWGTPAFISAIVALIVALVNRRMPFQQKLNEAQIAEVRELWKEFTISHRERQDRLEKVTTAYVLAHKEESLKPEDFEYLNQRLYESFLTPDLIGPIQNLQMSIMLPASVEKAVNDYLVLVSTLVPVLVQHIEADGPEAARQFVGHEAERAFHQIRLVIREALCINELSAENERAAGVGYREKRKRARLRKDLASPHEALEYRSRMHLIGNFIARDLQGEGNDPSTSPAGDNPKSYAEQAFAMSEKAASSVRLPSLNENDRLEVSTRKGLRAAFAISAVTAICLLLVKASRERDEVS